MTETFDDSPVHEDELADIAPVLSWAFAFPLADAEPWLRRAGVENLRVLRRRGAVEACAVHIPMGQFFGGKRVPMVGIAGVATSAESRGTGASIELMRRTVRELHARGVALSTLYPATLSLYRKLGYEEAGGRYDARVPLGAIDVRDRELPVRAMTEDDAGAVEACYRARAGRRDGFVDRGAYIWHRVRSPRDAVARGFVVGEGDRVEGYALVHEKRDPSLNYALHATDLVASTPRAHRRLLTLAADHGTLGTHLVWSGAPNDPFVRLVARVGCEVRMQGPWMLRVVDVAAAMSARGWPAHASVDLELDVADDVLAGNAGRWLVHVANGRAEVARGGRGSIRIDVRALAALYSGWMDPFALVASGGLEAPDADLSNLSTAFAGPAPWMPDFF